jgi:hypothetical protein
MMSSKENNKPTGDAVSKEKGEENPNVSTGGSPTMKGVRVEYSHHSVDTGLDILDIHAPVENELSLDNSKPHSLVYNPKRSSSCPESRKKVSRKDVNIATSGQKKHALRTREPTVPVPLSSKVKTSAKATGTHPSSEISTSPRTSRSTFRSPLQSVYTSSSSESYNKKTRNLKRRHRDSSSPRTYQRVPYRHPLVPPLMSMDTSWGYHQYPMAPPAFVPPQALPWGLQHLAQGNMPAHTLAPPGFVSAQVDNAAAMVAPMGQQLPPEFAFQPQVPHSRSYVAQQGQQAPPDSDQQVVHMETVVQQPMVVQQPLVVQQPMVVQQGQQSMVVQQGQQSMIAHQGQLPLPTISLGEHQPSPFRPASSNFSKPVKPASIQGSFRGDSSHDPNPSNRASSIQESFVAPASGSHSRVTPSPLTPSVPDEGALSQSTPRPSLKVTVPNFKLPPSKGSAIDRLGDKRVLPKEPKPTKPKPHVSQSSLPKWGDFSKSFPEKDLSDNEDKNSKLNSTKADTSMDQAEARPWKDMVYTIGSHYDIGERSPSKTLSRVHDTLNDVQPVPSVRSRLPLYPALVKAFTFTQEEIQSSVPAKGKDPCPMAKGKFPKVDKRKRAHPPSSLPNFLTPAPFDFALQKMAAGGNSVKENVKTVLAPEVLRKLEEDQRTAVAAMSTSLWSLTTAEKLLTDIALQAPTNSGLQDAADLVSAAKKWTMVTADRLVVGLSTSLLLRRDAAISGLDNLIPASTKDSLRAAPLLATSLLGDRADTALAELLQARVANKPTQAIKEIVSLTKALAKPKAQSFAKPGNQKAKQFQGKQQPTATVPSFNKSGPTPAVKTATSSAVPSKKKRFRGPKTQKGSKQ